MNVFACVYILYVLPSENKVIIFIIIIFITSQASQVVNPSRETYTFLIININAANINAPRFSKNLYQVEKLELEPVGSVLVTTTATDTDFVSKK